eukprot:TRINITY_DN110_c0_g1_i3.p1 TRINITY_DN110_c0_g1~~TRINITY_DN110_c0_g1_i3.p1  ORF type:complete len:116 (-),score=23.80 TRINITY_DN110_c0_g1_i3:380-727(-)
MQVSLLIILAMLGFATASTWQAAPYTLFREKRSAQNTRFFTGNNFVDTAAAGGTGAALGVATQYFTNQIFNPCTSVRNTNNRIFGGQTLQNGALGFAAGFAGASLVNSALGNPCG